MEAGPSERDAAVQSGEVTSHKLADDGTFPNNARLPALIYRAAFILPQNDPASIIENVFRRNDWGGMWRNGIYSYHHYHSTAHEVLGVAGGTARVQLGGDSGPVFDVSAGDAIVVPAGVAHKNLGSSADFLVVGAYPEGQEWDMMYGHQDERPRADQNIRQTPRPQADPLFGREGPLIDLWE